MKNKEKLKERALSRLQEAEADIKDGRVYRGDLKELLIKKIKRILETQPPRR